MSRLDSKTGRHRENVHRLWQQVSCFVRELEWNESYFLKVLLHATCCCLCLALHSSKPLGRQCQLPTLPLSFKRPRNHSQLLIITNSYRLRTFKSNQGENRCLLSLREKLVNSNLCFQVQVCPFINLMKPFERKTNIPFSIDPSSFPSNI